MGFQVVGGMPSSWTLLRRCRRTTEGVTAGCGAIGLFSGASCGGRMHGVKSLLLWLPWESMDVVRACCVAGSATAVIAHPSYSECSSVLPPLAVRVRARV